MKLLDVYSFNGGCLYMWGEEILWSSDGVLDILQVLYEFSGFGLSISRGDYAEISTKFLLKWTPQGHLGF